MRQLIRRCKEVAFLLLAGVTPLWWCADDEGRRVLEGGFGPVGLGACAALLGYDLFLADVTDEDA
jgi:hypothetical protein